MVELCLVVDQVGGAAGRVGAREVLRHEQGSEVDEIVGLVHVLVVVG